MVYELVVSALVAAYSAPLTRVHIDTNEVHHTPQLVYVRDESAGPVTLRLEGETVQYILQIDRAAGFGAQLSAAIGPADIEVVPAVSPAGESAQRETLDGVVYGGQARLYAELVSGQGAGRSNALTMFTNFRAVYYGGNDGSRTASQTQLSAGIGLMAEIALGGYVSVLPYAWFSPSLRRHKRYATGTVRGETRDGVSLSRPLRVGLDVWIYPSGQGTQAHISASVIASIVDTSGNGAQETAVVVGWTF